MSPIAAESYNPNPDKPEPKKGFAGTEKIAAEHMPSAISRQQSAIRSLMKGHGFAAMRAS